MNTAASYTLQADAAKNGETRLNFSLPRCLVAFSTAFIPGFSSLIYVFFPGPPVPVQTART
jgi:hypothetical protein